MKKFSFISMIFALLLFISAPLASANISFKDVNKDFWALKAIEELSSSKIINGYGNNTFKPNQAVTRAEAAIMIAKALELDTKVDGTLPFKDVPKQHSAYKFILAVYDTGIMSGYNNTFNPNKGLTRGEMAIVLTKAFDFKQEGDSSFKDIPNNYFAKSAISQLIANNITKGYPNNTFQPNKPTTRAEFAVLLSKSLNTGTKVDFKKPVANEEMAELLKEINDNEIALESYEFEGRANIGISLPETDDMSPEEEIISEALKNIEVTMSGAYVKDPMQIEMTLDLVLDKELDLSFSMPIIMNTEKMWFKLPDSDLLPLPEEAQGKFIEMDLEELSSMSPEDAAALDMELQLELSKLINDLVADSLSGFYKEIDPTSVDFANSESAHKVIKFEINKGTIKPLIETMLEELLPGILEIMKNPEYAAALGITEEDLELLLSEELELDKEDVREIVRELNKVLKIRDLSSYVFINDQNQATDNFANIDVELNIDGEKLGFKLNSSFNKSKIDEEVTFKLGIPTADEIITLEELEDLLLSEDYDYVEE